MDSKYSQEELDILYKPRTGDEMRKATLNKAPIYKYSELCDEASKVGIRKMLANMFSRGNQAIVLLQDPKNPNSGHWFGINRIPRKREIYFFSTYGGKPDIEKIDWMSEDELVKSGQILHIFQKGLRDLQQRGWEIHYNDHPYQYEGDDTAFCGIMTAAFLRSGQNPDEFFKVNDKMRKRGINSIIYYFKRYF